jgi:predicted GNAT family N-acyltransferase
MSITPVYPSSIAIFASRLHGVTLECRARIEVECNGASVIVKPTQDLGEQQAAFRFLYEMYVETEKLVSPYKLPRKCVASRSKWDKWDRRPSTRHIVAKLDDGKVVGHVRLLYRKDGPLPLEENGFSISPDTGDECEVSKLVIHPEYRRSGILSAFYRHIFHICRTEQGLESVVFSSQRKHEALYERIGAVSIGDFMNTELDMACTVMRITFVDTYAEKFGGGLRGRRDGNQEKGGPCKPS